jgi:hypothetical protein
MREIVVPIIATWMKFLVTPVLGFIAIFGMVWGARKFFWGVEILRGVCPLPPKATRRGACAGLAVHLVIVMIGVAAGYFLLALLTTQPYVITEDGITVGARPPHYREKFVPWNRISRVVCSYDPEGHPGVAHLYIYTQQGKATSSNDAVPLEPVYEFLRERLPEGEVERCG